MRSRPVSPFDYRPMQMHHRAHFHKGRRLLRHIMPVSEKVAYVEAKGHIEGFDKCEKCAVEDIRGFPRLAPADHSLHFHGSERLPHTVPPCRSVRFNRFIGPPAVKMQNVGSGGKGKGSLIKGESRFAKFPPQSGIRVAKRDPRAGARCKSGQSLKQDGPFRELRPAWAVVFPPAFEQHEFDLIEVTAQAQDVGTISAGKM